MILPDGSLVFDAAYSTQGIFNCGSVVPCSGSGSSTVTLGSGSTAVTISFTGVSTTAVVGNVAMSVPLGSFEALADDPLFTFPTHPNPNVFVLGFTLMMTQTSPAPGSSSLRLTFGPGGSTVLPVLSGPVNYFAFPTGPNPPGFSYTQVVYSLSPFPFSIRANEVTALEAQAGVVPEPATLGLVGGGLALIATARRRRTRVP